VDTATINSNSYRVLQVNSRITGLSSDVTTVHICFLFNLRVFEAARSSEPRGLDRRGAPAQAGPKLPTKDVETSDSGRLTERRETPIPSWHLSTKSATLYTESYLLLTHPPSSFSNSHKNMGPEQHRPEGHQWLSGSGSGPTTVECRFTHDVCSSHTLESLQTMGSKAQSVAQAGLLAAPRIRGMAKCQTLLPLQSLDHPSDSSNLAQGLILTKTPHKLPKCHISPHG
jgi:hypothetical protein